MTAHPDAETFERFAIGALDDEEAFVRHVGDCSECSALLQREARLELSLFELAEPPRVVPRQPRRAAGYIVPALVLAAAAGLLLSLKWRSPKVVEVHEDLGPAMASFSSDPPPAEQKGDADQVIAALRPQFRACYQAGLAADPTIAGTVLLAATVGADGEVTLAWAEGRQGLPEAVVVCLVGAMRRATFAPGSPRDLRFPVTFAQQK